MLLRLSPCKYLTQVTNITKWTAFCARELYLTHLGNNVCPSCFSLQVGAYTGRSVSPAPPAPDIIEALGAERAFLDCSVSESPLLIYNLERKL